MTAEKNVRLVSLVLSALSTGGFFGTRAALGPSTENFTSTTYVEVQQATIRNLRPVMGTLLPSAVVANAAVLALSQRRDRPASFALTGVGLAAQLTSLILTGLIELPINATVMTWTPTDPPEEWQALRDRWASVHTVRTFASVVGFSCLAAAAVRPEHARESNDGTGVSSAGASAPSTASVIASCRDPDVFSRTRPDLFGR